MRAVPTSAVARGTARLLSLAGRIAPPNRNDPTAGASGSRRARIAPCHHGRSCGTEMTWIRVEVRNSELGFQLSPRLHETTGVVWNSDSLAVQIETDDHPLLSALRAAGCACLVG